MPLNLNPGFADCLNMLLRIGVAIPFYGRTIYTPDPAGNPVLAIFAFFTATGTRRQGVITSTGIWYWTGSGFTNVSGPGALVNNIVTWTVVNGTLLFSDNYHQIYAWNGNTGTFAVVSANAPIAAYLMELDFRLVVANTIEGGVGYPQRVRWTNSLDPTDWTSQNAGFQDLGGDLGPIQGLAKINQQGWVFAFDGEHQMQLTGNGLSPFYITPYGSKGKGLRLPYTLSTFGEEGACFVGQDNVYMFDGFQYTPLASVRSSSGQQFGARTSLFLEMATIASRLAFGLCVESIEEAQLRSYWLWTGTSVWVYNFDEQNWTRATFTDTPNILGITPNPHPGPDFDGVALGCTNGKYELFDATKVPDQPWSMTSGWIPFQDQRHNKHVTGLRIVYRDRGSVTLTVTFTNEKNVVFAPTPQPTIGGNVQPLQEYIVPVNVSGVMLQWKLSGPAGVAIDIIEVAPYYQTGGEYKNT
jgi:hypothetical protein